MCRTLLIISKIVGVFFNEKILLCMISQGDTLLYLGIGGRYLALSVPG
jgi:hypothetical protein